MSRAHLKELMLRLPPHKPSFKNNSYFFSFMDGIRGRKEIDKSIGYFLTAPNQAGFTLIELMVTVVLLAIIAAIAVPVYLGYKKEAQTQEAWLQLTHIADLCSTKAIKAIETHSATTSLVVEPLPAGEFFNFDATPTCTTSGGIFTATGHSGSVVGGTLTVTVTMNGSTATKTWGGTLF